MTDDKPPHITLINGFAAVSYGRAWIASSPGGRWTCLDATCGKSITTSTRPGKTDEEREADRVRLHRFAQEHAHTEES